MFYPLGKTLYFSFFRWNMIRPTMEFVGFDNYINLFRDPINQKVLTNTLIYVLLLLMFNLALPYVLCYILSNLISKHREFYKSAIFLPNVISLVVGSILYLWLLNPVSGPFGIVAGWFAIQLPIWTKTDGLVIVVISLITSWKVFGYNFLVLYAGVNGISTEILEAAKLDNLSHFQIFKDIVIPMSSATGIYVFIITIVQGLQQVFTPIKVITQGGPNYGSTNLTYHSYHNFFGLYQIGDSSALSIVTMVLFSLLLYLEFRFVEGKIFYEN